MRELSVGGESEGVSESEQIRRVSWFRRRESLERVLIPGKFRPKRGGVNCKGRDQRVEKMANIGILVLRGMSLQFTWNTVVD